MGFLTRRCQSLVPLSLPIQHPRLLFNVVVPPPSHIHIPRDLIELDFGLPLYLTFIMLQFSAAGA